MAKYKVIIPFYKLSESKDYKVGDEIELSKEEAKAMEVYLEIPKETKVKK
jgi:hypothetical protein